MSAACGLSPYKPFNQCLWEMSGNMVWALGLQVLAWGWPGRFACSLPERCGGSA